MTKKNEFLFAEILGLFAGLATIEDTNIIKSLLGGFPSNGATNKVTDNKNL